ncbi:MAG: hypothetical protein FJX72_05270, partial [Armatimonadetes bacterium]|nr:hypothetical protein [Armatimonadota bacterium]
MSNSQHTTYICTDRTFRSHAHHQVRWLERSADYELAAAYWAVPLSEDEWLGFAADGYRHAAVIP